MKGEGMELNEMRELALEALGARLERIKAQIEGLRNELAGRSSTSSLTKKKHTISIEGRKRIAAAQKRRWALTRKSA